MFIGDKPGSKNKDPRVPFVGTKSYKTLLEWIYLLDIDIHNVKLYNSSEPDTEERIKHQIFITEVNSGIDWRIIALGKNASKFMDKIEIEYFELPHPSGLNRKLNDKKYIDSLLKECKKWLGN